MRKIICILLALILMFGAVKNGISLAPSVRPGKFFDFKNIASIFFARRSAKLPASTAKYEFIKSKLASSDVYER